MQAENKDFMERYFSRFSTLCGIILSDKEGTHISSRFAESYRQQSSKYIETSTMLIEAMNQTDNSLDKMHTKQQFRSVCMYYPQHLIHMACSRNMVITLIAGKDCSVGLIKQIAGDMMHAYQKLNEAIPQIKNKY